MSELCPVPEKAPGLLGGGEGRGVSQPARQWEEHRQASPRDAGPDRRLSQACLIDTGS